MSLRLREVGMPEGRWITTRTGARVLIEDGGKTAVVKQAKKLPHRSGGRVVTVSARSALEARNKVKQQISYDESVGAAIHAGGDKYEVDINPKRRID
jgi:hypothetical protein